MTKKDNKFHCHLLQQHARLETRGPSTTLLNTTWPPSGLSAHLPFIIINAKRCVGSTLEGLLSGNSVESGSTSSPLGSTWVHLFVTPMGETSPLRVHSSPLGSTLWGTLSGNEFETIPSRFLIRCGFESQRRSRERRNLLIAKGLLRIILILLI